MRAARTAGQVAAVAACALAPVLCSPSGPAAALAPATPAPVARLVGPGPAHGPAEPAAAHASIPTAAPPRIEGQPWAGERSRGEARQAAYAPPGPERPGQVPGHVFRPSPRHVPGPALGDAGAPARAHPDRDTAPGNGGRHVVSLVLPLGGLLVAALLLWYLARYGVPSRRRPMPWRRSAKTAEPPGGEPGLSLEQLNSRARGSLLDLDDAVRDRAAELSFSPGTPPRELGAAAEETAAALRSRHQLDEPAVRRDRQEQRRLLEEILARCEAARHRLAAVPDGRRPREALRALRPRADGLPERLGQAERAAGSLPPGDPVRAHPRAARERLARAVEELGRAGEGNGEAVRAAQVALVQAEALAESVSRRARELDAARARLAEELPLAEADLATAREEHALHGLAARAEPVLDRARRGESDPFRALRELAEVDGRLAEAVGPNRAPGERAARARTLLGHALLVAGSELAAAQDYVSAHRDRIGTAARARLAEAAHHLWRARRAGAAEGSRQAGGAQRSGAGQDADETRNAAAAEASLALPLAWRADALARAGRAAAAREAGATEAA